MFERRNGARFALEALPVFGVLRELLLQYFDRHLTPELGVVSQVDAPHGALPQAFSDLVAVDVHGRWASWPVAEPDPRGAYRTRRRRRASSQRAAKATTPTSAAPTCRQPQ